MWIVYAVVHPLSLLTLYVGKTHISKLGGRVIAHLRSKAEVIEQILEQGHFPIFRTLEICADENTAKLRENYFILLFEKMGQPIDNALFPGKRQYRKTERKKRPQTKKVVSEKTLPEYVDKASLEQDIIQKHEESVYRSQILPKLGMPSTLYWFVTKTLNKYEEDPEVRQSKKWRNRMNKKQVPPDADSSA